MPVVGVPPVVRASYMPKWLVFISNGFKQLDDDGDGCCTIDGGSGCGCKGSGCDCDGGADGGGGLLLEWFSMASISKSKRSIRIK